MGLFQPLDFSKYNDAELLEVYNDLNDENETELNLEIIESLASDHSMFGTEKELSERFDEYVNEFNISTDDVPRIRTTFCDWTDGLSRDGELHRLQDNNYCYVGDINFNG